MVYFPEGNWINFWDDRVYEGGKRHIIDAPLDTLPLFIRQGAILPLGKGENSKVPSPLEIHLYPSENGHSFVLYEDDGETFNYTKKETFEVNFHYTKENG
jgi:alpha-glucosidase